MRTRSLLATLAAMTLLLAACSDDGGSTSVDAGGDGTTAAPDPTDDGGGGGGGECPAEPFTGTISREADDDHAAADLTGDDIVSSAAFERSAGVAYTLWLTDYELTDTSGTVEAPEGQVAVTLTFQREDGLAAGDVISSEEGVVSVTAIVDAGGGASANTTGSAGTITVLGVDENQVCFDIDYTDELQSVSGTVSAEIVGGF